MFLVDPEFLGREICEEKLEQLARLWCNQFSCVARGCFIKYFLWQKIEVDTLYFSANSRLTTSRIIACKIKTSSTYPSRFKSAHCRFKSALKRMFIVICLADSK